MCTISLHRCTAADLIYPEVCAFAHTEYECRYGISLDSYPDEFIYAKAEPDELVGCFGASWGAHHDRLTTEWYVSQKHLMTLTGGPITNGVRLKLTEIGTRVVRRDGARHMNSIRISTAMAAALLLSLVRDGGKYSIFTADRSVQVIAHKLRVPLLRFGSPDLSRRSEAYRRQWHPYFNVPRECFGIDLEHAAPGCRSTCAQLAESGSVLIHDLFPEYARHEEILLA